MGFNALQITDVHLDLYYTHRASITTGCHFPTNNITDQAGLLGDHNCDTPLELARGMFQWAAGNVEQPQLILWTGDSARHTDFKPNRTFTEVLVEIEIVLQMIQQAWPGVPIVASLGNNDVSGHDQPVTQADLIQLAPALKGIFPNGKAPSTFMEGGYYVTEIVEKRLTVVALNSLDLAFGLDCNVTGSSQTQMRWLAEVLASQHRDASVIVMGHVPPSMFQPACRQIYAQVTLAFNVAAHIYGHQHMDVLNFVDILGNANTNTSAHCHEQIVAFGAPSVLPNANPALRLYHLDPDVYTLQDYTQYYNQLESLNMALNVPPIIPLDVEYRFTQAYGVAGRSLSDIHTMCDVWQQVLTNVTVGAMYERFKFVSSSVRWDKPRWMRP